MKRILIVNTLEASALPSEIDSLKESKDLEVVIFNTEGMRISPCLGCNHCWLKTPGICSIKDDYEQILKEFIKADQYWVISDTDFGFINYKGKNVIDRIMPYLTMYLHFHQKQMCHIARYDKKIDVGVIYRGEADKDFLTLWLSRFAKNLESKPLGVYSLDNVKEAVSCIQ